METWATVLVALIVALSTLGATFIQSWRSDKRFKLELGRAVDVDIRKRRWEVRGEPLLKLRAELARMASKLDKLAKSAHILSGYSSWTEEQAKEALKEAGEEWNNYISGDDLQKVLFILDDAEIINQVKKIRNEYLSSYDCGTIFRKELTARELGEAARAPEEKIGPELIKLQGLINKRLEEL